MTAAKPTSISELKQFIVATGLRLPEQQERVARLALAHPEIVAFGTAHSLADRCMVSPSTVVRVANALGFESFKEFRQFFRQHVRAVAGTA
ncbi:MurR/RpiR family transcriptional regulator [Rhizobium sp. MC63]|uniref:MurR/RpiR family transcriptional regulator n=1 Tax=Rhizobium mulingense TaxID=3031128 RepID=A0ACC6N2E3_9HYPH|nr:MULTISPECIES: MurR/RpiR family transcriptional regulator [unclassified Rhizobium]MDF0699421.1 MurR/RpiR family transcriptional regulator [Rhizobium sp. MC63]MEA3519738.1 MurR/RpiR family transcriptional regulator [Rhizobium sp. MJ31]